MRWSVVGPSMLSSQRVFQKISLPLKNARFDARVAGRFDVGALAGRPVLVVPDREERLVLEDLARRGGRCRRR